VDIHSSFQQITWGTLAVQEELEPVYFIREMGPSISNIDVSFVVSTGQGKTKYYYNVTEHYRVRYTEERIYLLKYEPDI
jgi:asparagine N-glycosylation enzyme membrane subunit Stt3